MDRNSLSHPQECPREGGDAFGEELAGGNELGCVCVQYESNMYSRPPLRAVLF